MPRTPARVKTRVAEAPVPSGALLVALAALTALLIVVLVVIPR